MKLVIKRLTDQRKRWATNQSGQLKTGMMVNDDFDPELKIPVLFSVENLFISLFENRGKSLQKDCKTKKKVNKMILPWKIFIL
jgi:hypothetical protein